MSATTSQIPLSRALFLVVLALPLLVLPACSDDASPASPAAAGGSGGSGAAGAGGAEACKGIVKSATGNCAEEMFCKYGLAAFQAVNESIVVNATAKGIEADLGDSFVKLVASPDTKKVPAFKPEFRS